MEPPGVSRCRVREFLKEWWRLRGLKAGGGSPAAEAMEGGEAEFPAGRPPPRPPSAA